MLYNSTAQTKQNSEQIFACLGIVQDTNYDKILAFEFVELASSELFINYGSIYNIMLGNFPWTLTQLGYF